ncbi:cyclic nucleotide-binding domain-containing protein [Agrobacterium vitis]|uniref:cyclic nucleotide-binding domain-containing protein n=1 Tax=Agrobacterium vitis TaxID=373 RepID=UPI000872F29A|nr:cyclic nucleotide-binding domain-containing protein [Agrobacterium vitis]MCE6076838.1 cyclic nucleotide-binding domain-containing protein [Agrobacterium vitis]MCM2470828.1 cyclic nucleotide-binding domain-containing protein [Agrobacterium vitis]MUO71222.1 cyclic nucleotide-binding domain-containing protein [Agrobacterium vitis]MUO84314.1 cyclic nucleotide-binding domain-containing protein [Agrobacterium vitis]
MTKTAGSGDGLFSFVWRHSRREQIILLTMTVVSFPILYFSLGLPKFILNGALQGEHFPVVFAGVPFGQLQFLWLLCALFLFSTILNGIIKMRLGIYRGLIGERLIRRLRYSLLSRSIAGERPHAGQMSQNEVVLMITAEAEPLTGTMGDAFAQPLFQAGQMLTILVFLFMQNVWLGVAGISLIPLQAYLIPRMQRQVNRLQHQRVAEVRRFSEKIGESVSGARELRQNGGVRYRLAEFSNQLQNMFVLRDEIFRRKFFIKFINNLITQLTPFLFFSLGGYLVIQGQLSIGALIAALGASRDIADPWRELLLYWNTAQEATSRYRSLVGQFPPAAPARLNQPPALAPRLNGEILIEAVTIKSISGGPLISDLELTIAGSAMVAVKCNDAEMRRSFCDLFSSGFNGEGRVSVGGHALRELDTDLLAMRIAFATSSPFIFKGTTAENIRMPLRQLPADRSERVSSFAVAEATRTGNSSDDCAAAWVTESAGFEGDTDVEHWWLKIIDAIGTRDSLIERSFDCYLTKEHSGKLASRIVSARTDVHDAIASSGLSQDVDFLIGDQFNPALTVAENLMWAVHRRDRDTSYDLAPLLPEIASLPVAGPLHDFAKDMQVVLVRAFGEVGLRHPMLRRFSALDPELYKRLIDRRSADDFDQDDADADSDRGATQADLLSLGLMLTPREIGTSFQHGMPAAVVSERLRQGAALRKVADTSFEPIDPDAYNYSLTVLENLLFGLQRGQTEVRKRQIRAIVEQVIIRQDLEGDLMLLIGDVETGLNGENLSPVAKERLAMARALIRRPDIVIMDTAMASSSPVERQEIWKRVRRLLPESTIIVLERDIEDYGLFDRVIDLENRHSEEAKSGLLSKQPVHSSASNDQQDKFLVCSRVPEFKGMKRGQLELLAFAAQWVKYSPQSFVFRAGDVTDGAYIVAQGKAELRWPNALPHDEPLDVVEPGRLIGDLSVILEQDRTSNMVAIEDLTCLRINPRDFLDIVESDASIALLMLRTVGGHLIEAGAALRHQSGGQ